MIGLNSRGGWKYNEDSDTTLSFGHNNLQNQSKPIFAPRSNQRFECSFCRLRQLIGVNASCGFRSCQVPRDGQPRARKDMKSKFDAESRRSITV